MKIKAAVVYEKGDPYKIEEVDLAEPKADEVLIMIAACGICHSDQMISDGKIRRIHPVVPGHEGSGIVKRVGARVAGFAPGDRVCMSFSHCKKCRSCVTGKPYECTENMRLNFEGRAYDGTTRLTKDGVELSNFFNQSAFATYSVTHKNNLVHVPEGIDIRLAGPLGCGIQTGAGAVLNSLKPEPGSSIVIVGCGGVGMSALMAAKICGCSIIIAVDTIDTRLDLASTLGATHIINSGKTDPVSVTWDITNGGGADYAVNSSGDGSISGMALECTGCFGKLAMVGGMAAVPRFQGSRSIVKITQGCSVPQVFIPKLIDFHLRGLFPFEKMVKFYDFKDINSAVADSHSGKTIKPVLVMDG